MLWGQCMSEKTSPVWAGRNYGDPCLKHKTSIIQSLQLKYNLLARFFKKLSPVKTDLNEMHTEMK